MKHKILTTLFLALCLVSFSQSDSSKKRTMWLRPSFENGVSIIRNEYLKRSFSTNSTYNWGVGIRFGNAMKNNLLPFIQFSTSKYTTRNVALSNQIMDSVLSLRETIAGFIFPVKRMGASMWRAKAGFIRAAILDEISKNSGNGNGVQVGLGFETKIEGNSRVFIDCSYDLIKHEIAAFRDYDLLKLSIGVVL